MAALVALVARFSHLEVCCRKVRWANSNFMQSTRDLFIHPDVANRTMIRYCLCGAHGERAVQFVKNLK